MADQLPLVPTSSPELEPFVTAGVLRSAEVQVAATIIRLVQGTTPEVGLAVALCVRQLLNGHVCIGIDSIESDIESMELDGSAEVLVRALPWPNVEQWKAALSSSPAVLNVDPVSGQPTAAPPSGTTLPLVYDGTRLYLERYWRYERVIGDRMLSDAAETSTTTNPELETLLDQFFGPDDPKDPNLQRLATSVAMRRRVTVIAGGPGTGKTYTVARLIATAIASDRDSGAGLAVALAAPTGKAAARMGEAVALALGELELDDQIKERISSIEARTLHRLLGWRPDGTFRYHRGEYLPYDLVVVDETSMVDLPMMARLLEALSPKARLVLVGDPFQLASVDAGAVLGDVVGPAARLEQITGPISDSLVVLQRVRRFAEGSAIAKLANAVRSRDSDSALSMLTASDGAELAWVEPNDTKSLSSLRSQVSEAAVEVVSLAQHGDGPGALEASTKLKVLCATRWGTFGSYAWTRDIEQRIAARLNDVHIQQRWYVGRPVIVTRNDYVTGVFNGDTGVVVERDNRLVVAVNAVDGIREMSTSLFDELETWWAMTVHKSQGSEFNHVVVSLPENSSAVLSNELLYTAITRAKHKVTVVGTEAAIHEAVENPIRRASGLHARLWD
ncbi:MAG: exodeoxyribonuclease V subunit alpha [Acidimicrobiales bacterium]|nr:exodeoxyribonuclease V subunit alpha [Acidimicrobiales bacterium]